jgi:pyruvate dehydrogenase E2 component (dihydrolipoamide acetyltransferase)
MTVMRLEQLSISMEDGKVLRWLVADGDRVAQGDIVVEVETDKATVEVESPTDGTIAIVAVEGTIVPIDGVLGEVRDTASAIAEPASAPAPAATPRREQPSPAAEAAENGTQRRPIASPAARRLAAERSLELGTIAGSGPGGRIVARDLGEVPPPARQEGQQPFSPEGAGLREAVVRNITASWQQIPHVQIGGELAADGLLDARARLDGAEPRVTITDLLVSALVRGLREVPELNGTRGPDGRVGLSELVHLSLAVATRDGVVAPVIRDAGSLTIEQLGAERGRLVAAARAGSIDRRDLGGGTITLSNLGAHPVDFFAPVVSGPQIAMVATGRIVEKPVAEKGWIAVRARMWANVAIDHRAADGEAGGRLLGALERQIASLPERVA